jgi:hypothetical protein
MTHAAALSSRKLDELFVKYPASVRNSYSDA